MTKDDSKKRTFFYFSFYNYYLTSDNSVDGVLQNTLHGNYVKSNI